MEDGKYRMIKVNGERDLKRSMLNIQEVMEEKDIMFWTYDGREKNEHPIQMQIRATKS